MLDDFHGGDWDNFEYAIQRVFPDREIVEIPKDDPAMQIFFRSISGHRFPATGTSGG